MLYCIIGPPGSGKTTQAQWLATELDIAHFKMSELLRHDTSNLPSIQPVMTTGALVADRFVFPIVTELLEHNSNLVIDGFPRSPAQAVWLMAQAKRYPVTVILIELSDGVGQQRLAKRGNLNQEKRIDDTSAVIADRLAQYHKTEQAIADVIETNQNLRLITVNGNQSVATVHQEIISQMNRYSR